MTSQDSFATRWRLWTIPNLITTVRLACIPWFVWLVFGADNLGAAAWLLAVLGSTDWIDGWVARRFNQTSEFGKLYDPTVDRLLFIVALPSAIAVGALPMVIAVLALGRELIVVAMAAVIWRFDLNRFGVTWEGKTGTFLLMIALPMFLAAASDLSYGPALRIPAWMVAVPGLAYGWYALLFQYLPETRRSWLDKRQNQG